MRTEKRIFIFLSLLLLIASLCDYTTVLNKMEYIIWGVLLFASTIHIFHDRIACPPKYFYWLVLFVGVCSINAIISQYSVSIFQYIIGLILTLIPFIYFTISYNYKFSDTEIIKFIDAIVNVVFLINCISFAETFIFGTAKLTIGFVGSSVFWFQYLASVNNQAIILSLALLKLTNNPKYKYYIIIFSIYVILSIQLKTYIGLAIIFIGYTIIYNNRHTIIRLFITAAVLALGFCALLQVPQISNKVNHYSDIYNISNEDGVARTELYRAALNIAIEHFPFGTGQGTFGSIPANIYDSRAYSDYQLEYIWGLSKYDDVNFRMDTHWSSVFGENGFLGTILYLILFFYPIIQIRKYRYQFKDYYFLIIMCYSVISIESIALNLINRFVFIVIYAGLSGLILRRIKTDKLFKFNNNI